MKAKDVNFMRFFKILPLLIILTAGFNGCGGEADTITPDPISQSLPGTVTGAINPQVNGIYPSNGSTGIPVDTDIVIVFSKPVDPATINTVNITITGVTAFNVSFASDNKVVILDITAPANLPFSTLHTINVSTGVTDSDGNPALAVFSSNFTTAADGSASLLPRVVAASRYPVPGSTGVSRNLPYVEVTFSKDMDFTTFNIASFSISGGVWNGVTQVNNKTYRLNLNTLAYGTAYTVTLNGSIQDSTGGALVLNGDHTWGFTTENDPVLTPLAVEDVWVYSVTDTSAVIQFTTSLPVARADGYAVYSTTTPVNFGGTHQQGVIVAPDPTVLHTVTITGLSPSTGYYVRGGIDTAGGAPVEILSASEVYFQTASNASVNDALTAAAGDQDGLVTLQTNGTGSYAFWVSGGGDIYGQYFRDTDGSIQWGANGTAVSTHANTQNGIVSITDGFTDAIVVFNDLDNLRAKMVYGAPGFNFRWGGDATTQGLDLGLAIKPGSKYSAAIVHERPLIITSGVADMPDNGAAANLLFDADTDFSSIAWLNAGNLLLRNMAGINWTSAAIENQNLTPTDIYNYTLKSTAGNPNLASFDFRIADTNPASIYSGIASGGTLANELRSITNANFLLVNIGDIIRNTSDNEWGIANTAGTWDVLGYYKIGIDRVLTNLADGDSYEIYTNYSTQLTSEAVTNPLWDNVPTTLFNPGVTVQTGDRVVNENNNTLAASSATVSAIDLSRDTNYALRLSTDIMNNNDIYSILRMPLVSTYRAVGYTGPAIPADYTLVDTFANYVASSVVSGDIVFNVDGNLSSMVLSRDSGTQLTLSSDIFNAINDKYVVYNKRGFLVAYVDTNDYIRARAFNIADGLPLGAAFNVCTDGVNSNPTAVSDGAGNAMIFYEKAGNIYAKKVSARGEFLNWGAGSVTAAGAGRLIFSGYTIVQVIPDRAVDGTNGAYLLAKNTAGTAFTIVRVNGNDGTNRAGWPIGDVTGRSPAMAVDYNGTDSRVIVTYRVENTVFGYYHVRVRGYNSNGAVLFGPTNVTPNNVSYTCLDPVITMADNNAAADDGFYISWFDGRFFHPSGYSIYAQRFGTAGAVQWAANGIFISTPTSKGYDNPLLMRLLYWNDGWTPYGLLPIWLDYRNGADTDIYLQRMDDTGTPQ